VSLHPLRILHVGSKDWTIGPVVGEKNSNNTRGFQEVEAPRFQDNRHIKVVRLAALGTGRLYLQEIQISRQ